MVVVAIFVPASESSKTDPVLVVEAPTAAADLAVLAPTATPDTELVAAEAALPASTEAPTEVPTETPTSVPLPDPVVFTGFGSNITPDFSVSDTLLFVEEQHDGTRSFAVWLKDAASGENIELAANEIGAYNGALVIPVDSGTYYYEIEADGNWSVTTKLPGHWGQVPDSSAYNFADRGARISSKFHLVQGRANINMTHDGEHNFAVYIYDINLGTRDLLANEIGPYSGSGTIAARDGIYVLDVEADGNWQIQISQ
jgi:hypothetical protein